VVGAHLVAYRTLVNAQYEEIWHKISTGQSTVFKTCRMYVFHRPDDRVHKQSGHGLHPPPVTNPVTGPHYTPPILLKASIA